MWEVLVATNLLMIQKNLMTEKWENKLLESKKNPHASHASILKHLSNLFSSSCQFLFSSQVARIILMRDSWNSERTCLWFLITIVTKLCLCSTFIYCKSTLSFFTFIFSPKLNKISQQNVWTFSISALKTSWKWFHFSSILQPRWSYQKRAQCPVAHEGLIKLSRRFSHA